MKIKRYDPTPYNQSRVVERPNGEYVKYTDYAKLEERVLALQDHCPHTYGRMYPNNECALCGKVV